MENLRVPKILTTTNCDRNGELPTWDDGVGGMMIFSFDDIRGNKVLVLPVLESVTRPNMGILCRMALLKSEE